MKLLLVILIIILILKSIQYSILIYLKLNGITCKFNTEIPYDIRIQYNFNIFKKALHELKEMKEFKKSDLYKKIRHNLLIHDYYSGPLTSSQRNFLHQMGYHVVHMGSETHVYIQ